MVVLYFRASLFLLQLYGTICLNCDNVLNSCQSYILIFLSGWMLQLIFMAVATGSVHVHNFPVRRIFKSIMFSCDSRLMVHAIISPVHVNRLTSNFRFRVLCMKTAAAIFMRNKLSLSSAVGGGKCHEQKKHIVTDPQSFKHDLSSKSHPQYLCLSSFCVTRHFH